MNGTVEEITRECERDQRCAGFYTHSAAITAANNQKTIAEQFGMTNNITGYTKQQFRAYTEAKLKLTRGFNLSIEKMHELHDEARVTGHLLESNEDGLRAIFASGHSNAILLSSLPDPSEFCLLYTSDAADE